MIIEVLITYFEKNKIEVNNNNEDLITEAVYGFLDVLVSTSMEFLDKNKKTKSDAFNNLLKRAVDVLGKAVTQFVVDYDL